MECLSFPCDRCGLCCEHLSGNELYQDLDNGSGICRYFDTQSRLCTIYEFRPLKCNVIEAYVMFQQKYSFEEYIRLNIAACAQLKREYQHKQTNA